MKFGEFVEKIREEQGIDVRTFAEKTGVDSSTVSRTENLQTETTMFTAFRICEGLGISPYELVQTLEGKSLSWLNRGSIALEDGTLTVQDIQTLVSDFSYKSSNRKNVVKFLTDHLNRILEITLSETKFRPEDEHEKSYYTPSDINRSLFNSPISFKLDFKYPIRIRPNIILDTYQQNGALIFNDVEIYRSSVRAGGVPRFPTMALSHVTLGNSLERMRVSDVLEMDAVSEQDGKIIGMYWEACRFYDLFARPIPRKDYQLSLFDDRNIPPLDRREWMAKLASLYIIIFRWYQTSDRIGSSWQKYETSMY